MGGVVGMQTRVCFLLLTCLLELPGIGNVFESADSRAAFSGSFNGHARGA